MGGMVWAVGLMSGTSLDGIDVALIRTDGIDVQARGAWLTVPYDEGYQKLLHEAVHGRGDMLIVENKITRKHAEAVKALLKQANVNPKEVRVVGFHGQTVTHRPREGITWQIGNGALLAELTGIDVVCDFRRRDVAAGGQGAPLVPLYHAALARSLNLPVAVLNLGGIGNVSWIGRSENTGTDILAHDIMAFDTGPANVMLNDWALQHTGKPYDKDGALALAGKADMHVVERYMSDPFFKEHPPKSLDRNYFSLNPLDYLSPEDGAATLTEFAAQTIADAEHYFPAPAKQWLLTGGGRHNPALVKAISDKLPNVKQVEDVGWEGDAMEAQAFAYLAVRSLLRLPLTLPTTTGVNQAVTGGALYPA